MREWIRSKLWALSDWLFNPRVQIGGFEWFMPPTIGARQPDRYKATERAEQAASRAVPRKYLELRLVEFTITDPVDPTQHDPLGERGTVSWKYTPEEPKPKVTVTDGGALKRDSAEVSAYRKRK